MPDKIRPEGFYKPIPAETDMRITRNSGVTCNFAIVYMEADIKHLRDKINGIAPELVLTEVGL